MTRALILLLAVLAFAGSGSGDALSATPDFGPNVKIFTPAMTVSQIKATVDAVAFQQGGNEFTQQRYALLFMPGTYGSASNPLNFQAEYYTEVAGLGALPGAVTVNGTVDSYDRCSFFIFCNALTNFHRSLANLTINVAGKSGCRAGEIWAASQQSPIRRVQLNGPVTLQDACVGFWQLANGGFAADSTFSAVVNNGLQQQFLVRNSRIGGWSSGFWNQVFVGTQNAPSGPPPYTTVAANPVSRERPFLYVDSAGQFQVYVPDAQTSSVGPSWTGGQTPGRSIPIGDFYIARPGDTAAAINAALAQGKNLLFTPGVYNVDQTIRVDRADTVVLGLGFPSLDAQNGVLPMAVGDVPGVSISGLIFDAGPVSSPALLQVGSSGLGDPADPTALHDLTFRLGGPHVGKATFGLVVNSDDVILDDLWAWRADHGTGVGWTSNTGETGIVVNGDDVTATGVFAEHFQKHNLIWNGERGRTMFFESELPYDAPSQAAYQHDGVLGYTGYKVGAGVATHEAWGGFVASLFRDAPSIHVTSAVEAPTAPGVRFHDVGTISILNLGVIDHIVNGAGPATNAFTAPVFLTSYP